MIESVNIVFIHKGNSWYLPYVLWQCMKTNPKATIYLIGDKQTQHFIKWIKHIDINNFDESVSQLHNCYVHNSNLGVEFELTCIERWFILLSFMQKNNLDNCIYLDSDILVYNDLKPYFDEFSLKSDMTWCSFSAHSNFISNRDALDNYCKNVIESYKNNFPIELKEKSLYQKVLTGKEKMNISDMTFFYDYNIRYPKSLIVINEPNINGSFDISMEEIREFEDDSKGFKKVEWEKKIPYCFVKKSQLKVPFVTLHFQGRAKKILKNHFKSFSSYFIYFLISCRLELIKQKLIRKIFFI